MLQKRRATGPGPWHHGGMRTTLTIDDTVLAAARSLAFVRGISLGEAVSELARLGLGRVDAEGEPGLRDVAYSPFPVIVGAADRVVTDDMVNVLRDD